MTTLQALGLLIGGMLLGALWLHLYLDEPVRRAHDPDAETRSRGRHPSRLGPPSDPPSAGRTETFGGAR